MNMIKYVSSEIERLLFFWLCSSRTETPSDKMMNVCSSQNSRPVSAPCQEAPAAASTEKNEVIQTL